MQFVGDPVRAGSVDPFGPRVVVRSMRRNAVSHRIPHGVEFSNLAFYRMNGQVQRIGSDDPMFGNPYEISLGAAYDDYLVAQAGHLLHFVTANSHSAENLERLFAAPLLQPYLHLFWVIYGGGGNGKGILLGSLRQTSP